MKISAAEKAYAAGTLDGGGLISMARVNMRASKISGNAYWEIVVTISSRDLSLIKWLDACWKGSLLLDRRKGPTRRPQHSWKLVGKQAIKFLRDIQPFVIIESSRLKWALEVNMLQSRPRKTAEPYSPHVKADLIRLKRLFD